MKIKITENQLREIIKETIDNFLNEEIVYDYWNGFTKCYITEGLTCTYSIKKIENILKRKYDFKNLNIIFGSLDNNPNSTNILKPLIDGSETTRENDNWYSFSLTFKYGICENVETLKDIIHTCEACGWYLADTVYYLRNDLKQTIKVKNNKTIDFYDKELENTSFSLIFRAKFNAEYKPKSIPPFLYHVAPLRVVDKILRQGLTPRNNDRIASHPQRVYLFLNYPNDWKENVVKNFKKSGKKEEYVLLEIDTRKLKNIKFYYDSNVMLNHPAIYTLEPIPPTAIKVKEKE